MQYEVENKYPVADLAQLQRRLAQQSLAWRDPVEQVDLYFAHPGRDFATTDEALRLRRVGPLNYVTYKGPKIDATTKTRREIEPTLGDGAENFAKMAELFESLGFRRAGEVHKRRHAATMTWQGHDVELALDDVAGLGTFIEIELAATASELDAARAALKSLAAALGLERAERRSYLQMLLAAAGRGQQG